MVRQSAVRCRACARGDCADCARLVLESAGCEHVCDTECQLHLFTDAEVRCGALPARRQRDNSR